MELVLAALLFTTLLMSVAIIITEILDELRRRKRAIAYGGFLSGRLWL